MNNEPINITIPLQTFVDSHLGRRTNGDKMWTCRPINRNIAEIIYNLTQNKHTCFIQWDDEFSVHLKEPLLWDFTAWLKECDRHIRAQAYSQKQREERFILETNIRILSNLLKSSLCLEEPHNILMASKLLIHKQFGKIHLLAPTFIIKTKIEEI